MARSGHDAQASFRLPQALYERLKTAAGDRPIGDEMRRRLDASFTGEPPASADTKTNELLAAIAKFIAETKEIYGKAWHEDPWLREVLIAAATVLVKAKASRGEPIFDPAPETIAEFAWGENERDPVTAGQSFAMAMFPAFGRGRS